jgi:type VI protein secretion system component VasF
MGLRLALALVIALGIPAVGLADEPAQPTTAGDAVSRGIAAVSEAAAAAESKSTLGPVDRYILILIVVLLLLVLLLQMRTRSQVDQLAQAIQPRN